MPRPPRRHLAAPILLAAALLAAGLSSGCASDPPAAATPRVTTPPPQVPVVVAWPAGTRFRAALSAATPDTPADRAARVWWREALRQTVVFELHDGDDRALPGLELTVDRAGGALTACLVHDGAERVLAGERIAGGDVAAAIDRLAWASRLALAEPAAPPVPVAAGTSATASVAVDVEDAMLLARDGGFQAAWRLLVGARARDGASPFVLEPLAALALLRGDPAGAERIAREALRYEARLLPTTHHRLARTLLLARASLPGNDPAPFDRELLQLAEVTRRERPHDPQPVLSAAIAHDFLGEFATARPLLDDLATRLPDQPIAAYHRGWACLGSGAARAAVAPFEQAAVRLPTSWVLLPLAIAAYEAGLHDRLAELLRGDPDELAHDELALERLRMQAAHALLRADGPGARTRIAAVLTWLGKHPQIAAQRGGELAEQGMLLVRLGGGDDLPPLLTAMQNQHAGTTVADVCAFLTGYAAVHRTRERQPELEARLGQGGDSPWAALLVAYAHEVRGEIADMQAALARAAQLSVTPMTKALLARGLRAGGRADEAERLLTTLRTEMKTLRLRAACRHPLLGPELAFVFVD